MIRLPACSRFDWIRVQENSDSTQYRYLYNSEGALERQAAITVSEDSGGNTVKTLDDVYSFEYDSLGRLIRSRQSLGGTIDDNDRICEGATVQHTQHIYDEKNRITSQTSVLGSRSYTSSYVL